LGQTSNGLPLLASLIATFGLLSVAACSPASTSDRVPASPERGGAVLRGDFKSELLITGELRAVRSIAIKAPQTQLFQIRIQFMADEGSVVRAGDPLLDFDNSGLAEQVQELESNILDAETQIVSKRNQLASALKDLEIELAVRQYEHDLARLEASIDPDVLSRKEHGERQLASEAATQELEQTREQVGLTGLRGEAELDVLSINRDKLRKDLFVAQQGVELLSIRAPADGLVVYEQRQGTTLRYQEGDSCWPGQGVMRLPDLSEMQVEFSVNEVDAPQLRVNMPVEISLDSFPGRTLQGRVTHVPSMAVKRNADSKVAIFKVLASLAETWEGEMKPGMSALGRIVVAEQQAVPLAPREVVHFDGESYWIRPSGSDLESAVSMRIEPVARNELYYLLSEDDYARLGEPPPGPTTRRASIGGGS
jgi:multidrug efflux pump subunit AcrA (membrane-fusion protein)